MQGWQITPDAMAAFGVHRIDIGHHVRMNAMAQLPVSQRSAGRVETRISEIHPGGTDVRLFVVGSYRAGMNLGGTIMTEREFSNRLAAAFSRVLSPAKQAAVMRNVEAQKKRDQQLQIAIAKFRAGRAAKGVKPRGK